MAQQSTCGNSAKLKEQDSSLMILERNGEWLNKHVLSKNAEK